MSVSPLRYPGGKTRACRILDDIINQYFNISNIKEVISPFFGGGSFEFYLNKKYKLTVKGNDKFKPLIEFWNCCNDASDVCALLKSPSLITKNTGYANIVSIRPWRSTSLLAAFTQSRKPFATESKSVPPPKPLVASMTLSKF
jgi:hypothetical protein